MGSHARTGARRAPAARAAVAAVLAALAGTVMVGIGSATETPAAPPQATPAPALTAPADGRLVDSSALDESALDESVSAVGRTGRWAPRPDAQPEEAQPAEARPEARASTDPMTAPAATSAPASVAPRAVSARTPAAAPALVPGTPCTAAARACVDLVGRKAWLIGNGTVVRGPVAVMTGDLDDPTPRGTFTVEWKAEQYTSREYLVQMPYSVFFADGGIAFHEGRQDTFSAGCVKLVHDDAVAWFSFLQVGDQVQVH